MNSWVIRCCTLVVVVTTFMLSHAGFCDEPGVLDAATLVESRLIWDKAQHNAFTDLLRFKDHWYCVFREGSAHVSPDGALRILRSADG